MEAQPPASGDADMDECPWDQTWPDFQTHYWVLLVTCIQIPILESTSRDLP